MKTQANGCTGPEEIAAQAKAQEMMTAHEITEADLTEAKPGWLEEFFNNIFTRDDRAEGAWERYLRAHGTWENYEQYRRKKQGDQQKRKEEQRKREAEKKEKALHLAGQSSVRNGEAGMPAPL